jgi:hypothetical protein
MIDLVDHSTNHNNARSADVSDDIILQSLENLNINDENNDFLIQREHVHDNKLIKSTKSKISIKSGNSRMSILPEKNTVNKEPLSLWNSDSPSGKENVLPIKASLKSLNLNKSNTKFFVTKSNNMHDIQLSYDLNLWSTTVNASEKILKAYNNGATRVILFVSLNLAGKFYGALEVKSISFDKDKLSGAWETKHKNRRCFKVEWLVFKPVANRVLRHVTVSPDNEKPVTSLKNGFEIASFSKGNEILDIMFRYVDF